MSASIIVWLLVSNDLDEFDPSVYSTREKALEAMTAAPEDGWEPNEALTEWSRSDGTSIFLKEMRIL